MNTFKLFVLNLKIVSVNSFGVVFSLEITFQLIVVKQLNNNKRKFVIPHIVILWCEGNFT